MLETLLHQHRWLPRPDILTFKPLRAVYEPTAHIGSLQRVAVTRFDENTDDPMPIFDMVVFDETVARSEPE